MLGLGAQCVYLSLVYSGFRRSVYLPEPYVHMLGSGVSLFTWTWCMLGLGDQSVYLSLVYTGFKMSVCLPEPDVYWVQVSPFFWPVLTVLQASLLFLHLFLDHSQSLNKWLDEIYRCDVKSSNLGLIPKRQKNIKILRTTTQKEKIHTFSHH